MTGLKKAETFELDDKDGYRHSVAFLDEIDQKTEPENEFDFDGRKLYEEQNILANWSYKSRNIVFAAPSSAGKTTFAFWAANIAIQAGTNFIFVVADDFHKQLLNNELMRHNFQGVCTENMTDKITSDRGLIITIQKIREMVDSPVIQRKQVYIFDDMDQLLNKDTGYIWEEVLVRLPPKSQYIFTLSNFDNVERFASWIATIYQNPCHVLMARKRPFNFNFNISVPQDLNNMRKFCLSSDANEFSVNNAIFNEAMQSVYSPRRIADMVEFVRKCTTTFPVRVTVEQFFSDTQPTPTIVVAFDDDQSKLLAQHFSGSIKLLDDKEKLKAARFLSEVYSQLDENEDAELSEQISKMVLNGIAFLNRSLPKRFRDLIEALFRKDLIFILVVTEEIAINSFFRTRNLVVTSCRKKDGTTYRYLTNYEWQRLLCLASPTSGKNLQIPTVTLILDWKMKQETLEQIILPQRLEFHSTKLNREDNQLADAHSDRTFYRFLKMLEKDVAESDLVNLNTQLSVLADEPPENSHIREFLNLEGEVKSLREQIDQLFFTPSNVVPYLSCGRLIQVIDGKKNFGIGIVIDYEPARSDADTAKLYVALRITRDSRKYIYDFHLLTPANQDELDVQEGDEFPVALVEIVEIPIECVKIVYATRVRLPSSLRGEREFNFLYVLFNGLDKCKMHPVEIDVHEDLYKQWKTKTQLYESCPIQNRDNFDELLNQFKELEALRQKVDECQKIIELHNHVPSAFMD